VRTAVNITGDSAVTCVVARSEGQLATRVFHGEAAVGAE
jgi:Na+/H+-dicarboxylate symporter